MCGAIWCDRSGSLIRQAVDGVEVKDGVVDAVLRELGVGQQALGGGHLASVGDFAGRRGSNLRGFDGGHRESLSIQANKLYFVGLAVGVYVHDGSDIARTERFGGDVSSQDDAIVFLDHDIILALRIGCYQARSGCPKVDNPNRSQASRDTGRSL